MFGIIGVMKPRKWKWDGHAARMRMIGNTVYAIFQLECVKGRKYL
jgi:hypothetical protein